MQYIVSHTRFDADFHRSRWQPFYLSVNFSFFCHSCKLNPQRLLDRAQTGKIYDEILLYSLQSDLNQRLAIGHIAY